MSRPPTELRYPICIGPEVARRQKKMGQLSFIFNAAIDCRLNSATLIHKLQNVLIAPMECLSFILDAVSILLIELRHPTSNGSEVSRRESGAT